jgi:RNA ligase (TIGR02306 family)
VERSLVHIEKVEEILPIKGADFIDQIRVLGWSLVAKKGEFQVGDLCVFFEIDSLLPEKPEFEFMRAKKFRVKTQKFRGVLSQGLALPLDILPKGKYKIEQDVADMVGVKKYEAPIFSGGGSFMRGDTKGNFPSFVPKTDEIRIQSKPRILEEFKGKECYVSTKCDGTSATYAVFKKEPFVCSRNFAIKNPKDYKLTRINKIANSLFKKFSTHRIIGKFLKKFTNFSVETKSVYWAMEEKYCILSKISEFNDLNNTNYAIQGEICGPGIQKNKLGLSEVDLFVFNIYDIDAKKYVDFEHFKYLCGVMNVKTVPIVDEHFVFNHSEDELLKLAKGKYEDTKQDREGIVIRPVVEAYSEALKGRLSVKVINNDFLLKEE